MGGKIKCQECGNVTDEDDVLDAKNPFNPSETIYGCKVCFSIDRFYAACDYPGCTINSSCGFPTENGYVQSCSEHANALGFEFERRAGGCDVSKLFPTSENAEK